MIIDLENIDVTVMPNFKGGQKEFAANMFFDGATRIFKGRLAPGASIGMHTHEDSSEVIFVLEGNGHIVENEPGVETETIQPVSVGSCLYCPKGHSHSLQNTALEGDLVFYAVVPML